jgi:hypothetical protein
VVATPTGSVVDDLGSLTVQNLSAAMTAEHAARLAARRANGAQGQCRASEYACAWCVFPCAALPFRGRGAVLDQMGASFSSMRCRPPPRGWLASEHRRYR